MGFWLNTGDTRDQRLGARPSVSHHQTNGIKQVHMSAMTTVRTCSGHADVKRKTLDPPPPHPPCLNGG